ncbi:MAG: thioesterase family protein [Alphaproteobacteria bacterium]
MMSKWVAARSEVGIFQVMNFPAPYKEYVGRVRPEWIDYNGHMNVAYYVAAFDEATDAFYDALGLGLSYKQSSDCSTFTLEGHITYDQEVMEGDQLLFTTYLLDCDEKRLHYIHEMHHAEKGYLAATNELIGIHIDMKTRRSTPMPKDLQDRLQGALALHSSLPKPHQVGRVIGIRRKG